MTSFADRHLLSQIRDGNQSAWQSLINRYEGRLIAFVESRLRNRSISEDIVQETLMGFLISLPNYDESTPLESWLFTIAGYKLTDHFRKTGRRSTVPFAGTESRPGLENMPGTARPASSLMRSGERKSAEREVIQHALSDLIADWKSTRQWERLQCTELLFVLGWKNKDVADRLALSEQTVANHKAFVVGKLKEAAQRARLTKEQLSRFKLD
jgi:RNA polymerase sigma-70 factor, ECF subfamily